MIVHIGGWSQKPEDSFPYLKSIIEVVHELGGEIAHDWVSGSEFKKASNIKDDEIDWDDADRRNEIALERADFYIAEVSNYRLYHGYELAQTLAAQKPVLLVSRKSFRQFAISGVKNDLLNMREYKSIDDLKKIVKSFLTTYALPANKKELTVPINQQIYSHIRDLSERSHKTEGELLRDLAEDGLKFKRFMELS